MYKSGYEVRVLSQLHAKIYMIDNRVCLITSANLTEAGMSKNKEIGIITKDPKNIKEIRNVFMDIFNSSREISEDWIEEKINITPNKNTESTEEEEHKEAEEEDTGNSIKGKYVELELPSSWKSILEHYKEKEDISYISTQIDLDLSAYTQKFFESIKKDENRKIFIESVYDGQTFRDIGAKRGVSHQAIQQKVSKILKSEGLKNLEKSINHIFNKNGDISIIEISAATSLKNIEKTNQWGLIQALSEKKDTMIEHVFKATNGNKVIAINRELYIKLRATEDNYIKNHKEFLNVHDFLKLGGIEKYNELFFSKELDVFKKIYLSKNEKIINPHATHEALIEPVAWEIFKNTQEKSWHFSEMREALNYLFPEKFNTVQGRDIAQRLTDNKDKFQYFGSRGYWGLVELGDGFKNNKEAILNILKYNNEMHYNKIIKTLKEGGRKIKDESIIALLDREPEFIKAKKGFYKAIA